MSRSFVLWSLGVWLALQPMAFAQSGLEDLPTLWSGQAGTKNALWIENEASLRFSTTRRVVVADLAGPAKITMIHFAMPEAMKLNRDLLLRNLLGRRGFAERGLPFRRLFLRCGGRAGRNQLGAGQ